MGDDLVWFADDLLYDIYRFRVPVRTSVVFREHRCCRGCGVRVDTQRRGEPSKGAEPDRKTATNIAEYRKHFPHGLCYIASPRLAALVPACSNQGRNYKNKNSQKRRSKRLCKVYVPPRISCRPPWYLVPVRVISIQEYTANTRLQTH